MNYDDEKYEASLHDNTGDIGPVRAFPRNGSIKAGHPDSRQKTNGVDATRPLTLLLLAGALVSGRHVDNAVGINVEGHLHLRHSARGWGDSHLSQKKNALIFSTHFYLFLTIPEVCACV